MSALLVILSLLLVIIGGQHYVVLLSGSLYLSLTIDMYFSWQINSAAAVALKSPKFRGRLPVSHVTNTSVLSQKLKDQGHKAAQCSHKK